MFDLIAIVFGRFVFALAGAILRFCWYYLCGKPKHFSELWESKKDNDIIDYEDYQNRIIGFLVIIMGIVLLLIASQ